MRWAEGAVSAQLAPILGGAWILSLVLILWAFRPRRRRDRRIR